ncbi:hypothetical protein CROQUDRAFT_99667 [Cronartium quercuum f. sp. fusiforme G11]|uniref:Reverse transcriptase n=1 Tax=Cronartium quercuum f. sp. fusiforme G11 TaxID=708437 RepID=A0A9P6NAP7_9BASI|nr:hypothetical protein CROQUDRAFT_99667 [Cronartium quercuum f. sp. fusiforme G11]
MPGTISLGFIDDELRWGAKHGAAFDRKKSQWLLLTNRKLPAQLPTLSLGETQLPLLPQVKWLGVTIDTKLTFHSNGLALAKKGSKVALHLAQIACTGWGVPLTLFTQLISSLVHSRTNYAAVVWHKYATNTSTIKALQKVDNLTQCLALGVFKTHPLLFLKHNTTSPSALSWLDTKLELAITQLLTLPDSNPAGVVVCQNGLRT